MPESDITRRPLSEREHLTLLETLSDTPAHGIFENGTLLAVTPGYGPERAGRIADALRNA